MSNMIDAIADAARFFAAQAKGRLSRRRNLNSEDAIKWRTDFNLFDPYAPTADGRGIGANGLPESTAYCFSSRDRKAKEPTEWGA
jgi:hypothetical protein